MSFKSGHPGLGHILAGQKDISCTKPLLKYRFCNYKNSGPDYGILNLQSLYFIKHIIFRKANGILSEENFSHNHRFDQFITCRYYHNPAFVDKEYGIAQTGTSER